MIHSLNREQRIPVPLENVWEYFCNPKNLNEITPADMHFEILSGGNVKLIIDEKRSSNYLEEKDDELGAACYFNR